MSDLEENIIKKEILPIVTETIAPALKQVQRELVLVVDYVPGIPIVYIYHANAILQLILLMPKKSFLTLKLSIRRSARRDPKEKYLPPHD